MVSKKILIVEDDGIIAMHIQRSLIKLGYASAGIATSGDEAVALFSKEQPDLVLMDIRLEGKMDGVEAASLIQEMGVPVIFLTAYADDTTLERAKLTGPHGYILKPFEDRDLFVAIEIALNKHAAEKTLRNREQYLLILNQITQLAFQNIPLNELLKRMVDRLREIISADHCFITFWDDNHQVPIPMAASGDLHEKYCGLHVAPEKPNLTSVVISKKCPIVVKNTEDSPYLDSSLGAILPARSLLGLPLIDNQSGYGAAIFGFNKIHDFSKSEIERCEQAVQLISLSINKIKLLEETRQRAEELGALESVSAAMRVARTRAEITDVILKQLMILFKTEGAALAIRFPDQKDVKVELGAGIWESWSGLHFPLDEGITWQVLQTGQAFYTNHLKDNSHLFFTGLNGDVSCAACVPLLVMEKAIGVLWLGGSEPIPTKQVSLLVAIANMTASALHRQSLYEDLQDKLKTLEKTKDQLVQSEKLAAMGELVAGVAHELNNPLMAILMYAQLLQQRITLDEAVQDLDKIVSESRRAANIVKGLLNFARQRAPERKEVHINEIVTSSLDFLSYEMLTHGIQWSTHFSPDIPATLADPYQLQQVFVNLITNAWQAMNDAAGLGMFLVSTAVGHSSFPDPGMDAEPVIRITFQDNGPGIDPENLGKIFDPFFTTKPEGQGTGLGLAVCHGIITEHGGHIWVECEPSKGTTFTIELPIIHPEPTRVVNTIGNTLSYEPSPTARILIVEDEINVLEIVSRMLIRKGYTVDRAASGIEGLEHIEKKEYHLILCDLCMPQMSGQEFYQTMADRNPALAQRVLFTSGDIINSSSRQFLEKTGLPFLSKPFEMHELLEKVAYYVSKSRIG